MAITSDQYDRMLARLTALELTVNNLIVASEQYVTLLQVNQLLIVMQEELADVRETVTALETRVTGIENEPLT